VGGQLNETPENLTSQQRIISTLFEKLLHSTRHGPGSEPLQKRHTSSLPRLEKHIPTNHAQAIRVSKMVVDILKGIAIIVIGLPTMALIWAVISKIGNSSSYLAHGGFMTVLLAIMYFVFSNSTVWNDSRFRIYFGVVIAIAYLVGFSGAWYNKHKRKQFEVN